MDTTEYTIKQAADLLGLAVSTVRRRAALMQARKPGHNYFLTAAQVEQIRADMQAPGKTGPKPASSSAPEAQASKPGRKARGPHPDRIAAVLAREEKRLAKRAAKAQAQGA